MSPSTDRVALAAGAILVVFALSGLVDNSGLLRHDWWWSLAAIAVGGAFVVIAGSIRRLTAPPPTD